MFFALLQSFLGQNAQHPQKQIKNNIKTPKKDRFISGTAMFFNKDR